MFYEEKLVNGEWFYRTEPDGVWAPVERAALAHKIAALQARCELAESQLAAMNLAPTAAAILKENARLQSQIEAHQQLVEAVHGLVTQLVAGTPFELEARLAFARAAIAKATGAT